MADITSQVIEVISELTETPIEDISLDASLESLNIDSIESFQLLIDLEARFNIEINDNDYITWDSVQTMIDYLEGLINQG